MAEADAWSSDDRQEELDHAVQLKVQYGCRVESRSTFQAVVVSGRPVNHLLHFVVGLFTIGIWWLVVWLPLTITGGEKRIVLSVDERGRVHETESGTKLAARPAVEVRGADGELL
jgi:hypothetical protein